MVRELLDQEDWMSFHIEGRVMTADVGTKALAADRFRLLVERMRMARNRVSPETTTSVQPQAAKRLVLLLCVAALVDQVEAADEERGLCLLRLDGRYFGGYSHGV